MFFWIALPVVLVVFVCAVTWGVRGYGGRVHEPGTRHLYPEDTPAAAARDMTGNDTGDTAGGTTGDTSRSRSDERG